ncbi:tyrosine-type recombinase/integrase [Hansschlegelia sp.]|uniref:tyrosine-type recombinase/integrase n=1 Tax=Hansschlegelia sp. TaxID=2041892 RepID=UPI002C4208A7|nr:tyrosine-type recombinase/integrase [Hansschlegelia sp.]HVI27478.1 tyrosine-type recombinase/integrase [Hansschlegelia sp.]
MPRTAKGARLWLRRARREGDRVRPAEFIILDRGKHHPTGCGPDRVAEAERALARHIAAKHEPQKLPLERHPSEVDVADVLTVYIDSRPPLEPTAARRFEGRCERLLAFWAGRPLSDVGVRSCRDYADWREKAAAGGRRGGPGGARRDLEDLRAAIVHHEERRLHRGRVDVWLPEKGQPRERWLTRDEAAALLWACWRARERQTTRRGDPAAAKRATRKHTLRHIARFILIGLYTGTRAGAISTASFKAASGRSYVDVELGVFFRLAAGRRATKKRQPPVPLPPRLLAHMRRWARLSDADERSQGYVVEYHGAPVASVKTGFARAVALARLEGKVTPHTLRHTAATWLRRNGVPQFPAADFLGMSVPTLNRIYAHQDERDLAAAAAAIGRRPANETPTKRVPKTGTKQKKA